MAKTAITIKDLLLLNPATLVFPPPLDQCINHTSAKAVTPVTIAPDMLVDASLYSVGGASPLSMADMGMIEDFHALAAVCSLTSCEAMIV